MIVTRFAPSPTGLLHIGGVRTALFSWLHARRHGGKFILRIEDTDRERSTDDAVQIILDGLKWLGLGGDAPPIFQTARFDRYRAVLSQLLAEGHAYRCYCTKEELEALRAEQMANKQKPRYDGRWRDRTDSRAGVEPVIRFKNPLAGDVVVDDLVHGKVIFQNAELDDLIIARSDGTPTYNFCVVVDDMDMGITHVIRGDDHLNNTPRQINLLKALGATPPVYAHVPMILGADGAKLSKRHGAVSVLHYQEEGFLPDALLNYLVRLGWSHGDQEVFTREEMIAAFDIADVNKAASAFNPDKLLWLNQQHLMHAQTSAVLPHFLWHLNRIGLAKVDETLATRVILAQRERVKTLREMADRSRYFFEETVTFDQAAVSKHLVPEARELLSALRERLKGLSEWRSEALHQCVHDFATERGIGLGKIAQPLRVALTGSTVSPPIDATLELLGRDRVFERLENLPVT